MREETENRGLTREENSSIRPVALDANWLGHSRTFQNKENDDAPLRHPLLTLQVVASPQVLCKNISYYELV